MWAVAAILDRLGRLRRRGGAEAILMIPLVSEARHLVALSGGELQG